MPTMNGKVCLVTGATAGIGLVTARELAKMGATLVLVGRNPTKTATVVETLKRETGNSNISALLGDLSLLKDVRRVAAEFKQKHDRLHVLLNNAGAFYSQRYVTAEGLEMTFALNHLSYFLLTHLLLEVLKASAPARVVNVSSNAHASAKLNFDDLQNAKQYNGFEPYSQSKLMNILFTYELARRLQGTGVTTNCLHPGFIASEFGKNNPGWVGRIAMPIVHLFARTPEQGARSSLLLATAPELEGVTGKYYDDNQREARSSPASYDTAAAKRLWEMSAEITGITELAK